MRNSFSSGNFTNPTLVEESSLSSMYGLFTDSNAKKTKKSTMADVNNDWNTSISTIFDKKNQFESQNNMTHFKFVNVNNETAQSLQINNNSSNKQTKSVEKNRENMEPNNRAGLFTYSPLNYPTIKKLKTDEENNDGQFDTACMKTCSFGKKSNTNISESNMSETSFRKLSFNPADLELTRTNSESINYIQGYNIRLSHQVVQ